MRRRTETRIPISIGIPLSLLMIIDAEVDQKRLSRSEYIVGILQEKLADCEQRAKRGNVEFSRAVPFNASNQEADCEQKRGNVEFFRADPFNASNQVEEGA